MSVVILTSDAFIFSKDDGGIYMAEEFYCMKCRKKVQVDKFEKKTLKTKTGERAQLVGTCPACGGKVFKFVKA
ncbi:MAG: DUF5679 domain-containing protein [Candidatus Micrarchaeia archaeon]